MTKVRTFYGHEGVVRPLGLVSEVEEEEVEVEVLDETLDGGAGEDPTSNADGDGDEDGGSGEDGVDEIVSDDPNGTPVELVGEVVADGETTGGEATVVGETPEDELVDGADKTADADSDDDADATDEADSTEEPAEEEAPAKPARKQTSKKSKG